MLLRRTVFLAGIVSAEVFKQEPLGVSPVDFNSNDDSSLKCRCFPGDTCWPSIAEWSAFNDTVDGQLIATVPLASPCHDSPFATYDEERCQELRDKWLDPETHYKDASSVMAPFFANQSCDPYLSRSSQCIIGTYVQYTVNVSKPAHISNTIDFITKHNIRLVIRNTGHDYNGKSTGAGAVGLWMHHLKDIEFVDWDSESYQGPAIKMGAGVQGIEAYRAAHVRGFRIVGGECPTVGLAGGYTQGGGHSALASRYGLAADQALEWEVIDGTGQYVKANQDENSDLFWALSGGGGGTYGVVLSLTSKVHPDGVVSSFNLTLTIDGIGEDAFYKAVSKWHATLPFLVDKGIMVIWTLSNTTFMISPLTAPDMPQSTLEQLLQPFLSALTVLNIKYKTYINEFPDYLTQFNTMQWPIPVGEYQYGGRLIPRSVITNSTSNEQLTQALRYIVNNGGGFCGVGLNVDLDHLAASNPSTLPPYNAVLPTWRETLISSVILTPWNFTAPMEEMVEQQRLMTTQFMAKLEEMTPGGGAYMNEGDFLQDGWENVFYGGNFEGLMAVKGKWDPNGVFYANRAVGSQLWEERRDGRLCRL